jgi:hypothetical protein
MIRPLALAAALAATAAGLVPAAPAAAQRPDRVLRIFGDDKCPENEICVRAPESDRYRDPLRQGAPAQPEGVTKQRQILADMEQAGRTNADSCSAVGPGGFTGCFRQDVQRARAEQRQQGKEPAIPF